MMKYFCKKKEHFYKKKNNFDKTKKQLRFIKVQQPKLKVGRQSPELKFSTTQTAFPARYFVRRVAFLL